MTMIELAAPARPAGDNGTALDAIAFVVASNDGEGHAFLKAWLRGELKDWPDYFVWLAAREAAAPFGPLTVPA